MSDVFGNEESGFTATFGAERSNIIDYEDAINKPSINSHELIGDQSAADLGLATPSDIPTNTSDLENDSGYITNAVNDLANYYLKSETYTQAEVNALIPTKVSVLQNDSGYITSSVNDLANYYNKTEINSMLIMDISNTIFGGE